MNSGQLLCPAVKFACARDDLEMLLPCNPLGMLNWCNDTQAF